MKVLLDKMYLDLKVGLIWNYTIQYYSEPAKVYINEIKVTGRLVAKYVPKGLTSIMQVYDLTGNKY